MAFRDLVDQDHAVMMLRSAARSGRVSHAYLFVGPPGVGRFDTAVAFAQRLNCERVANDDACGQCRACTLIAKGQYPDVRVVDVKRGLLLHDDAEERKKKVISIEQARALRREVVYPPLEGRWKVYIFVDADQMQIEAGNSLLKVLEEPPPSVVIILLAESTVPMLATVVSRCQLVRFSLVPAPTIEEALISRHNIPKGHARFVAALAGGQLGKAITWATSEDALQMRERTLELFQRLEHADALDRMDAAEGLAKEKDTLGDLLDTALFWYRDILVWQESQDESLLINMDYKDVISKLAGEVPAAVLAARISAVEEAKEAIRRNVHPRLALETLFLRLTPPPQPSVL
jgi:DNA polymerase-3 subunit delta'